MKTKLLFAIALGVSLIALPTAAAIKKPNADFFKQSWAQAEKKDFYWTSCIKTIGQFTDTKKMAADDKKLVELAKATFASYKKEETAVLIGKNKILSSSASRSESESVVPQYQAGQITYEAALAKIKTTANKTSGAFIISLNEVYYRTLDGKWKQIKDAKYSSGLYKELVKYKLTSNLEKGSFKFGAWTKSAAGNLAGYAGKLKMDETKKSVEGVFGQLTGIKYGQAGVKINIDEKTKNWKTYEETVKVDFPTFSTVVKEVCQVDFKDKVKIEKPVQFETVDSETGQKEFFQLVNSL